MAEPGDGGRAGHERRVRELAAFGHRGSATDHERRAADYLATELTALGLSPTSEPFPGARSMGARLLVPVVVAAAGAGLMWVSGPAAAGLGGLALLALVHEQMTGRAWLTRFLVRHPSANVVARVPATGNVRKRVVVCAHYDSQRAGLIWNRFAMRVVAPVLARLPGPLKTPLFPLTAAMAAQVGFGLAMPVETAAIALLGVYAVAGLLFAEWAVRRPVPGASDNASGVAAVLALAGRWAANPVPGVELAVVLAGCEETGMLGSAAWCDRHRAELTAVPTVFLNVDSLGFGPPRFLGVEVPMAGWPVRHASAARDLAAVVAAEQGRSNAGPHALPGPTDGLVFRMRGLSGLTVVGFRGPGVMEYYHQPGDTVEHVDFDAAWDGVGFAWAILRRLAAGS